MSSNREPPSPPEPRFVKVLRERLRAEGDVSKLARAIAVAAGFDPDVQLPIDRRKLKKILDTPHVARFSTLELWVISCYLDKHNEGLGHVPFFEIPDFVQTLADSGSVTFLLGSRPNEASSDLSLWDIQSMAEIQRDLGYHQRGLELDTCCVDLTDGHNLSHGDWTDLLGPEGPSLVGIGSGRASPGSEAMLARMFEVEARNPSAGVDLPFRFVWPDTAPDDERTAPTSFAMPVDELEALAPEVARSVRNKGSRAFVLNSRARPSVFPAEDLSEPTTQSFGVVAVQRRSNNQVWMVIAGLSGASTFATARAVKQIRAKIPDAKPGENSKVLWTAIENRIDRGDAPHRPNVRAEGLLEDESHLWPPEDE